MQDLRIGDRVQMRKKHPCGSDEWMVERLGADVGLRCLGCNRHILLARSLLAKRLKRLIARGQETDLDRAQDAVPLSE
jgi:hypothetical protein